MFSDYEKQQLRLNAAFKRVQPATHWKDRIDATITLDPVDPESDKQMIELAVIHFTGTIANINPVKNSNLWRVRAVGYRLGPCGDH